MKLTGIDSCPLGWIVILHTADGFGFEAVKSIPKLLDLHPDLDRIFIDIPIGLSSKSFTRTIESSLRKELQQRASTIFTPACREAVYAANYDEAREINKATLGKSVSIQSYNISKKIKELDMVLESKADRLEIFESHPEICFKYLNGRRVIQTKKSTSEGFQERFGRLVSTEPKLKKLYHSIAETHSKSKVKPDDILDAMVLCVANLRSYKSGLRFLEDENNVDEKGFFIRIAY